jgi:hypothetical protein
MSQSQARLPLTLLRGPFIVSAVIFAVVLPHVRQLSFHAVGLLLLLSLGLVMACLDVLLYTRDSIRSFLRDKLDRLVLDDCLHAMFDPDTGLVALTLSTLLGSSALYTVASTEDQRVRLVQSGLWVTDPAVARTVLYQPGGCQYLLPAAVQKWLHQAEDRAHIQQASVTGTCTLDKEELGGAGLEKSPASSDNDDESITALYEDEKRATRRNRDTSARDFYSSPRSLPRTLPRRLFSERDDVDDDDGSHEYERHGASRPRVFPTTAAQPPMPLEVMCSILAESARAKVQQLRQNLPSATHLGATSVATALLLLIQLRSSRRARDMLWMLAQGLTTTSLVSILVASTTAVLATTTAGTGTGGSHKLDLATFKEKLKESLLGRHWKGWLAALVLLYVGRKKSSVFTPSRR